MTRYAEQSDARLVDAALGGDRTAFAVLIDRTLATVWSIVTRGSTDVGNAREATYAVYLDAMRELSRGQRRAEVVAWLTGIAERYAPADREAARMPPLALPADLADALWRDLDRRWPDGRPAQGGAIPWRRMGIAAALVVLAAVGPVAFVGLPGAQQRQPAPEATVEASPFASEPDEPDEPESSPSSQSPPEFEFPSAPSDDRTQAGG